jgi:hypothetical protein
MNPAGFTGASIMFTDLWTARKNALGLSKTLMAATLVITAGTHFSVITADEFDGDTATIVNAYDPYA